MLQRNKLEQKSAVASSSVIQKISMQTKYKLSFSTDLENYLEFIEFYGVSGAHFLEVFYQSCAHYLNNLERLLINYWRKCIKWLAVLSSI